MNVLFTAARWGAIASLGLWCLACGGDDDGPPSVGFDSSVPLDSGGGDDDAGAMLDAGVDAAPPTGFMLRGPCIADEDDVFSYMPQQAAPQSAPSLIAEGNRFGLVFAQLADCSDAITIHEMASHQTAPATTATLDECTAMRNAVGRPVANEWLVAWLDGRGSGLQVMATRFDPEAEPPSIPPSRTALTDSDAVKGSLSLILLGDSDRALLAWTETDAAATQSAIKVRVLNTGDGSPVGDTVTLREEPDELYTALTLSPLPSGGALLGFVAGSGPQRAIMLQRLDEDGAAVGDAHTLSAHGDANATVSIVMKDEITDRGAAVYAVNRGGSRAAVHFQALDAQGAPAGQYRILSGNLEQASAAGIAPTVSGYGVAYRAISDFNWDTGRLRLMYLSDVGNRVGDGAADVLEASDFGGAPALAIAFDGRVALSWFDDDEAGNRTLRLLLRYPCNP